MNYNHIEINTHCKPASAYEMKGVIEHLRGLGVPMGYACNAQDLDNWPALGWSRVGRVDQQKGRNGKLVSVNEFVALFEGPKLPKIGDYQPTIKDGKLKVGCQTIPFETVEAIYKAMKG